MAYYYYPYWFNFHQFLYHDFPLWILFFGLIYGLMAGILRVRETMFTIGASAFAASAAYFAVKNQGLIFYWIQNNWGGVYGTIVLAGIFVAAFIGIKNLAA